MIETVNGEIPIVDGTAELPTGAYTISWRIQESRGTPTGAEIMTLFGPFTQQVQVGTSRAIEAVETLPADVRGVADCDPVLGFLAVE